MNFSLNLSMLRATIFVPFVSFSHQLYSEIEKILPGIVPNVPSNVNIPLDVRGNLFPFPSWALQRQNDNDFIIFQPNKIDYIRGFEVSSSPDTKAQWENFIDVNRQLMDILVPKAGGVASRIAIAPKFHFYSPDDVWFKIISRTFAQREFLGSEMIEGDFTQTFRVQKNLGDVSKQINFVCKFRVDQELRMVNNMPRQRDVNVIDFDINTAPFNTYTFNLAQIQAFFKDSSIFCKEILDFYLD